MILFALVFFLAYLLFNKYVLKRNFEDGILPFANKNQNTVREDNARKNKTAKRKRRRIDVGRRKENLVRFRKRNASFPCYGD